MHLQQEKKVVGVLWLTGCGYDEMHVQPYVCTRTPVFHFFIFEYVKMWLCIKVNPFFVHILIQNGNPA